MRYAEVLLLYAEADNELNGPTQDAFSKMEMLNRRNNSTLVSERHKKKPFDKETFRSFILEERAKEFAVEGNRRTDLIRWGIYLPVMNAIGMDENGNLKRREEKHWLMPLPPDEINGNPYIEKIILDGNCLIINGEYNEKDNKFKGDVLCLCPSYRNVLDFLF